jgi:tetratricopeptide (TPR) repeat protein
MSDAAQLESEATTLRNEGKYEEAIAKLKQALELDEKFVLAHLGLAVLYHNIGDWAKSVAHGEKAVEIEPEDQFNYSALSVTYQRAFEGTRDTTYIEKAEDAKAKAHGM